MAYNTSVHSSTSKLHFIWCLDSKLYYLLMWCLASVHLILNHHLNIQWHSRTTWYQKTGNSQHQWQKNTTYKYDKKLHSDPYAGRNLVWVLNPKVPKNNQWKLFYPWTEPFKVLKQLFECTYRVQQLRGRRWRQIVHFNRAQKTYNGVIKSLLKNLVIMKRLLEVLNTNI